MTSYVVLQSLDMDLSSDGESLEVDPHRNRWEVAAPPVEAVSAEAAIRKAVDGEKGGTFVAVSMRSWAPVTVTVETKRTLKLA